MCYSLFREKEIHECLAHVKNVRHHATDLYTESLKFVSIVRSAITSNSIHPASTAMVLGEVIITLIPVQKIFWCRVAVVGTAIAQV